MIDARCDENGDVYLLDHLLSQVTRISKVQMLAPGGAIAAAGRARIQPGPGSGRVV